MPKLSFKVIEISIWKIPRTILNTHIKGSQKIERILRLSSKNVEEVLMTDLCYY